MNAHLKAPALVAGMVTGAGSIDDMDVLRHGGMGRLFTGVRAPSTLGTFLRTFTFGHVRQLDAVASRFLAALAEDAPILPVADQCCYVDIDDTIKATHGYAKQEAGCGYTGAKGLNALLAIVSTPLSAPVVAGTRLRRGGTNSARFVADALVTTKACVGSGLFTVRADSTYYGHDVIAAARRGGARFPVTVRMNSLVLKAISGVQESAWAPIHYPKAIWDDDEQRLVSDAEVPFTAFTSRRQADHISARLIVRRVRRLNPKTVSDEVVPGLVECEVAVPPPDTARGVGVGHPPRHPAKKVTTVTNTCQKNTRKTRTRPELAAPDAVTITMGEIADDLREGLLALAVGTCQGYEPHSNAMSPNRLSVPTVMMKL